MRRLFTMVWLVTVASSETLKEFVINAQFAPTLTSVRDVRLQLITLIPSSKSKHLNRLRSKFSPSLMKILHPLLKSMDSALRLLLLSRDYSIMGLDWSKAFLEEKIVRPSAIGVMLQKQSGWSTTLSGEKIGTAIENVMKNKSQKLRKLKPRRKNLKLSQSRKWKFSLRLRASHRKSQKRSAKVKATMSWRLTPITLWKCLATPSTSASSGPRCIHIWPRKSSLTSV